MNSFACPIPTTRLFMQRYSVLILCSATPDEPTGTILHVSSCHVETPPVPVTATQPATQPQFPFMTTQQSPIETVVATTTSANQSLCDVDSDADVLQNANNNGKLEKCATGMLYTHIPKLSHLDVVCEST